MLNRIKNVLKGAAIVGAVGITGATIGYVENAGKDRELKNTENVEKDIRYKKLKETEREISSVLTRRFSDDLVKGNYARIKVVFDPEGAPVLPANTLDVSIQFVVTLLNGYDIVKKQIRFQVFRDMAVNKYAAKDLENLLAEKIILEINDGDEGEESYNTAMKAEKYKYWEVKRAEFPLQKKLEKELEARNLHLSEITFGDNFMLNKTLKDDHLSFKISLYEKKSSFSEKSKLYKDFTVDVPKNIISNEVAVADVFAEVITKELNK